VDIYVIRHADAVRVGEMGATTDAERALSPAGESQAQAVAAALQRQGVTLDGIVTSPLRRALQTAEGIARHWAQPAPEVRVCEDLAPGVMHKRLSRYLRDLGMGRVALVGHEPDLSGLVAWLIGSKKAQVEMAKAGVAHIACSDEPRKAGGSLVWLVTPEWMRT
jgi:phosphohistidine phosphatase